MPRAFPPELLDFCILGVLTSYGITKVKTEAAMLSVAGTSRNCPTNQYPSSLEYFSLFDYSRLIVDALQHSLLPKLSSRLPSLVVHLACR
jgi:hypothetical protein